MGIGEWLNDHALPLKVFRLEEERQLVAPRQSLCKCSTMA